MFLISITFPAVESFKNITSNLTDSNTQQISVMSNWTETKKLLASDGQIGDYFGCSVSIFGDTALIGAEFDQNNRGGSGSAYVFACIDTVWTQQQILHGETEYYFGWSVSLYGDTALIGTASESVYVFIRTDSNWVSQAKLIASDGAIGDGFGISVSLDNDTALIGSWYDDDNGVDSGSAYVFTRTGTTWTQQAKLLASDGETHDWFGYSVALSGDTAIIGAPSDDDNGDYSGSAYVFTRTGTTWAQQAKLLPSDGVQWVQFGISVSLDDNTALIGAQYTDSGKGAAYVFTRSSNNWTQQQKLLASDGEPNDNFGQSVSLDGNSAIIGTLYDDQYTGSAYIFIRTGITWTQQAKLLASDGTPSDFFGGSVSLDDNTVIIGSVGDYDNDLGSAYVFTKFGLTFSIDGGIGVKAIITNEATTDANSVPWQIHVEGGMLEMINKTVNGTGNIPAGESVTVKTGLLLGFGAISITAKVADEEQTAMGTQLIIFSMVK
jgi:hypothetical protein